MNSEERIVGWRQNERQMIRVLMNSAVKKNVNCNLNLNEL